MFGKVATRSRLRKLQYILTLKKHEQYTYKRLYFIISIIRNWIFEIICGIYSTVVVLPVQIKLLVIHKLYILVCMTTFIQQKIVCMVKNVRGIFESFKILSKYVLKYDMPNTRTFYVPLFVILCKNKYTLEIKEKSFLFCAVFSALYAHIHVRPLNVYLYILLIHSILNQRLHGFCSYIPY